MTEFGKSPYLSTQQFEEMGYKIVIFPVTVWEYLMTLKDRGTQKDLVDRMFTRKELYELLDYDSFHGYETDFVSLAEKT
jgi:methylisocitrate lyase